MDTRSATQNSSQSVSPARKKPRGRSFLPGNRMQVLGRTSAKERAAADELERQAEAEALLADLGHPPTARERLLADEASALAIRGRRLRAKGQPSDDVARLLTRMLTALYGRDNRRNRPALEATPTALDRHRAGLAAGVVAVSVAPPHDPAMVMLTVEQCLGQSPAAPGGAGANATGEPWRRCS